MRISVKYWSIDEKKIQEQLTSNIEMQMLPPSTSCWIKVDRASSTRSKAFAMHRRASLDAPTSAINATDKVRRVDRLAGEERYSEHDGFFPRDFTANKPSAASVWKWVSLIWKKTIFTNRWELWRPSSRYHTIGDPSEWPLSTLFDLASRFEMVELVVVREYWFTRLETSQLTVNYGL